MLYWLPGAGGADAPPPMNMIVCYRTVGGYIIYMYLDGWW